MYKNYKVVVNTAAGRRRYMQYLIPYVVASGVVDRYDIWVNTHNGADIEFFKQVAARFPVVNLVWQPDGVVNGNASINAFYKACVEPDTIYFKLDDDIVWMEPDLIEKMVRFRVEHPDHFLVTPLVINNSLATYLLQLEGKLHLDMYYPASPLHPILWKSGYFAYDLHKWFLDKYLRTGKWDDLHIGKKEMALTRFSINAVLWFGDEMKKFGGVVPGDDEDFMSCIYPALSGKANAWNGDAIVAHFAFFPQREQLDKRNILGQYGAYLQKAWNNDEKMRPINAAVQTILNDINKNEAEWMKQPSPYQHGQTGATWKGRVKKYLPETLAELYRQARDRNRKSGFITE